MHHSYYTVRRLFRLLTFSFIVAGCTGKETLTENIKNIQPNLEVDSIEINILLNPGAYTALNFFDESFNNVLVGFKNIDSTQTVVSKKTPGTLGNQVIMYGYYDRNLKELFYQYFLIGDNIVSLDLEYSGSEFSRINQTESFYEVSELYSPYKKILFNYRKLKRSGISDQQKQTMIKTLDKLHRQNSISYQNSNTLTFRQKQLISTLNDYNYYDKLQLIEPSNKSVDQYLFTLKNPIKGEVIKSLFDNHVKNRIQEFNFSQMDSASYSKDYLNLLAIGVYGFLKENSSNQISQYTEAENWLRTTNWYHNNDKIAIEQAINPIDNSEFKMAIHNISLENLNFEELTIQDVLTQHKFDYYLIDFWATWCKPCIQGINEMKSKSIPDKIAVLSLSLDQSSQQTKWQQMSQELDQNISYRIKENSQLNEFVNLMGLQAIPRYIMIDNEMNLVDENWPAPHESDFMKKLKSLQ